MRLCYGTGKYRVVWEIARKVGPHGSRFYTDIEDAQAQVRFATSATIDTPSKRRHFRSLQMKES